MFSFNGKSFSRLRFLGSLAAAATAFVLIPTGCSGGGDNTPPCIKNNPEALATLKGRFVTGNPKTGVAAIVVTAGGASMQTGEDGAFEFSVPACTKDAFLKADLPEEGNVEIYDDHVVVDGDTWEIEEHGWPIPQMDEGAVIDLGDIVLTPKAQG
ncbi:MAG: hypothetical protein ACOVT5_12865 [Armatimonadaceae bacterium]|jgi:hypothetical protein